MPIIKSAKKRVRVTLRASIENSKVKRSLRNSIKKATELLKTNKNKEASKAQSEAYSAIDRALKKGILSKNKASRKKKQLNDAFREKKILPTSKKTSVKPIKAKTKKADTKKTKAVKTSVKPKSPKKATK